MKGDEYDTCWRDLSEDWILPTVRPQMPKSGEHPPDEETET